ncbi:MAG: tetratricopeptide repeat protein [Pseudomonadota bacterium]
MTDLRRMGAVVFTCLALVAPAGLLPTDYAAALTGSGFGEDERPFAYTPIETWMSGSNLTRRLRPDGFSWLQPAKGASSPKGKAEKPLDGEDSKTPGPDDGSTEKVPTESSPSEGAQGSDGSSPRTEAEDDGKQIAEKAAVYLKQARTLENEGNHGDALKSFEIAVKKAGIEKDEKTSAASHSGAARVCAHLGRDEDALGHLRHSIKLHMELKNAKSRSLDFILAGRLLMNQSKCDSALKSFEEAAAILPESESAQRPGLMEDTAAAHLRLGRIPEALSALGRVLGAHQKAGAEKEAARVLCLIGEIQVSKSDYSGAKTNFKKAESLYRKIGDNRALGETLFRIAYADQAGGELKSAEKSIEAGKKLLGKGTDPESRPLPLFVSGMDACNRGEMVTSAKLLSLALTAYQRDGDRMMGARVLLALASVEHHRARMKAALELSGKALREFRQLSDVGGEAASLRLIGELYFKLGYVLKGLEYAQEAFALTKKINDRNHAAESRVLPAEIHSSLGDTDFAWKLIKEALQEVNAGGNRRTRGLVRLTAARFRFSRGAQDYVLQSIEEAKRDFAEINDRRGIADCDNLAGQVFELRGEKDKALASLQKALEGHRAMWDRFGEGTDLSALGVYYKNLGDHAKATEYFRQAIDLRKGIDDRRGYAAGLTNIGNLQKHKNQMQEALASLEEALKVYQELGDKKGEADVLANLANVMAARGSQSDAMDKFTQALALHRQIQDAKGIAVDLTSMARLHLIKGELDNAATLLDEARKVNRKVNNPRGEVTILAELAMLQKARRRPAEALALLEQALKPAVDANDARAVSSLRLKTAIVLEDAGYHDKALALLQKTLEMMRSQGDRRGELWALGELGIIQVKMGDFENALANLRQAVELRSELGLPASVAKDLDFYLGEIYEGFKEYEQALEHYHKALAVAQISGTDRTLGRIFDRVANIYYLIDDYPRARDFFEDALRVHSETHEVEMQKAELIRLGDILSKLGDHDNALKYQVRALTLSREAKDERGEARILTRIGTLQQVLGRPKPALDNYREAKDKRTALGDRRGVNENLLQIALVMSILGDFKGAVNELKTAFDISQNSGDRSMLWKAYFIMGRTLQGKNRLGEALESYRKAMDILEGMEADIMEESEEDDFIFGGRNALYETTLGVLMKLARKDPEGAYDNQALKIVEKLKSASFQSLISRINVDAFSDLPQELLLKEKSLKLGLRKLDERLTEELSKVNCEQQAVKKLQDERRAKERSFKELKNRLEKEYPSYAGLRYPPPVSIQRLQKETIDAEEVVLEYMLTRSRTYIFVLDKTRFHTVSVDYALKDLERDVTSLLRPLHQADTQAGSLDPSIAYRMYDRLIKPVEYYLIGKKTVVLAPHGPLCSLPFEMLVTSKEHAQKRFWSPTDKFGYLLEKYAFSYVPSISVLSYLRTRKRDAAPGWNLAAFGETLYDNKDGNAELNPGAERLLSLVQQQGGTARNSSLRPLPGARREVQEIAKILGGSTQVYFGAQATETLVKKADLSRYRYVHFATHGILLGGVGKLWQQPAIVLSLYGDRDNDGFLQLGEVFGLKLNAEMVTLSSCLTPGGGNEPSGDMGLQALSRAFIFAGADSLLLGMWQGDEAGTAKMFIEMYKNLKDGSKAEALRKAKLSLLNDKATCHPYHWAPFILIGKWHVAQEPEGNDKESLNAQFKGFSFWRKLLSM